MPIAKMHPADRWVQLFCFRFVLEAFVLALGAKHRNA